MTVAFWPVVVDRVEQDQGIGFGGRGEGDLDECRSENIVALCDVDEGYAGRVFKKYPEARTSDATTAQSGVPSNSTRQ